MPPMLDFPSRIRRHHAAFATALLAAAAGCGTEPSDDAPGAYRLAVADGVATGRIPCFASTWRYEGGGVVHQGECDVALRGFTVRFDSARTVPALVAAAEVTLESEDTATWEIAVPAVIRNSTIEYDFGSISEPLSAEQVFVFPFAGTLTGDVLTLRMTTFSSSGLPDRTEYVRQNPTVFVLTRNGRPPAPATLAGRYEGVAFAGQPVDHCTTEVPSRCFHHGFTLARDGGAWTAAYEEIVTIEGDTVGAQSLEARNLTLTHTNGFVRITDAEPPMSVLHFEAEGSLVGGTLTLFPGFALSAPIVSRTR